MRKMCAVVQHHLAKGARCAPPLDPPGPWRRQALSPPPPSQRPAVASPLEGAAVLPQDPHGQGAFLPLGSLTRRETSALPPGPPIDQAGMSLPPGPPDQGCAPWIAPRETSLSPGPHRAGRRCPLSPGTPIDQGLSRPWTHDQRTSAGPGQATLGRSRRSSLSRRYSFAYHNQAAICGAITALDYVTDCLIRGSVPE